MAPITNPRIIFNEIPTGYPIPGKTTVYDTTETIDVETINLKPQSVVAKVLALSVDPYLRGTMRDPSIPSYVPAFPLGKPIEGDGIAVIIKSSHSDISVGDHVYAKLPFSEYAVLENPGQMTLTTGLLKLENSHNLPWTTFLGVLGMPGRTAYYGWKEFSNAKKGETAFITAGAGPVGSFVIQLAKQQGLKVIASAGSEEKLAFMKSLGADVVFNYKTESTDEMLKNHGPIDIFWDGVGGETFQIAANNAELGARFIECGMISGYNNDAPLTLKDGMVIVAKRLRIFGFIVWDYETKYQSEFMDVASKLVATGKLQHRDEITEGLDKAGDVILAVQKGQNKGKAVVVVAKE